MDEISRRDLMPRSATDPYYGRQRPATNIVNELTGPVLTSPDSAESSWCSPVADVQCWRELVVAVAVSQSTTIDNDEAPNELRVEFSLDGTDWPGALGMQSTQAHDDNGDLVFSQTVQRLAQYMRLKLKGKGLRGRTQVLGTSAL